MRNRITRSRLKFANRGTRLDFSNISSSEEIRERLTYLSKNAEDTRAEPNLNRSLNPSDSDRAVRSVRSSRIKAIYATYSNWLEGKVTIKTEGYRQINRYDSPFAYVFNPPAVYYNNVKREIPKMIKKTLDLINYYKYSYRRYKSLRNKRSEEASTIQVYLLQWSKYIQDYLDFMHDTFGHLIGLKSYDVSSASNVYSAYKDLVYLYSTNRGYGRTDERGVIEDPKELAELDEDYRSVVVEEYPDILSVFLDELESSAVALDDGTVIDLKNMEADDFFDSFLKSDANKDNFSANKSKYKNELRPELAPYEDDLNSLYYISKTQIDRIKNTMSENDSSTLNSICDNPEGYAGSRDFVSRAKDLENLKPKISNALGTLKYLIYTALPDTLSIILLKSSNYKNPVYDLTLLLLKETIDLYNNYVLYSAAISLSETIASKNKKLELSAERNSLLALVPMFEEGKTPSAEDFKSAKLLGIEPAEGEDRRAEVLEGIEDKLVAINIELKNIGRLENKGAEKLVSLENRAMDMIARSTDEDKTELENSLSRVRKIKDAFNSVPTIGGDDMNKQSSIKPLSRSSVVFKKVNTDYLPLRLSEEDSARVAEDKALIIMGNLLEDEKGSAELIKVLKRVYEFEKMEENLLKVSEYFKEENTLYDKLSVDLILVSGSIYNVYKYLIDNLNRKPTKPPVQFAPFIPVEGLDGVQVAPFLVASYTLGGGT